MQWRTLNITLDVVTHAEAAGVVDASAHHYRLHKANIDTHGANGSLQIGVRGSQGKHL